MLRQSIWVVVLTMGVILAGCGTQTAIPTGVRPSGTATAEVVLTKTPAGSGGGNVAACKLTPVVAPTTAPDPGYTALDPTTGLHMTGSAKTIDLASYRLQVTGLVDHPLSLSYDDLRCLPKVTASPPLICPGYFEDMAAWSGVPLKYVLELAGVQSGAKEIAMVSADKYENRTEIGDALMEENFLAYEWNGEPLPVLHGFPLRAVFPSMQGNKWVKWLLEIRVE
jgi:DMSO/TMAO reductase YedYZ molybdopterin-dependent catalytic subunit